jgi:hypothetical protein
LNTTKNYHQHLPRSVESYRKWLYELGYLNM